MTWHGFVSISLFLLGYFESLWIRDHTSFPFCLIKQTLLFVFQVIKSSVSDVLSCILPGLLMRLARPCTPSTQINYKRVVYSCCLGSFTALTRVLFTIDCISVLYLLISGRFGLYKVVGFVRKWFIKQFNTFCCVLQAPEWDAGGEMLEVMTDLTFNLFTEKNPNKATGEGERETEQKSREASRVWCCCLCVHSVVHYSIYICVCV